MVKGPTLRALREAWARQRIYLGRRPNAAIRPVYRGEPWVQANPKRIEKSVQRALETSAGGWYAVASSQEIGAVAKAYVVADRALVLWRDGETLHAAPEACPHMGASLRDARAIDGQLVCPWHGLRLGAKGHGCWKQLKAWDDGVLAWVQLDNGEELSERPLLTPRPEHYLAAVTRHVGRCQPRDILANRLDPWHGDYFHPYAFRDLVVSRADEDALDLRVCFRLGGPFCVEVDARFHCPHRRAIVMTIVDGDGAGSVVETHAAPAQAGYTAVVEAVLATSERPGFRAAQVIAPVLRWFMRRAFGRLWVDDIAYAERSAWLREQADEGKRVYGYKA